MRRMGGDVGDAIMGVLGRYGCLGCDRELGAFGCVTEVREP